MLRGRNFLRKIKGTQKIHNPPRPEPLVFDELNQQQTLPYELYLHIFSYLDDRNDIFTLCRTSRLLRSIAERSLYRSVELNFDGAKGRAKRALQILEAIRNPRLSKIVMAIDVRFQPCDQRVDRVNGEQQPNTCTCGLLDHKLGIVLQSMQSLEALTINCTLCMNLSTGRHHYLPELGTRKMRQFSYECRCTMGNSFDPVKLFMAPWIQSVTALKWVTTLWTSIPSQKLQELLEMNWFLPNLDTLHYAGSGIYDQLVTKRRIHRLSGAGYTNLATDIEIHPNKRSITHLSVGEVCVTQLIGPAGNIGRFCNLQHLGTIPFIHDAANRTLLHLVNRTFEPLIDLKHLSSIDGVMTSIMGDPWNCQILALLETRHPKLRKVFLLGDRVSCVWVLGGDGLGIWERRNMPLFTPWDMVTADWDIS